MGIDVADQWVRVQAAKDEARREATRAAAREVLESYGAADLLAMLGLDGVDEGAGPRSLVHTQPRVVARERQRESPGVVQPCGTEAAYQRHRRDGERACLPCLRASNEAVQKRNAARRLARAAS